MTFTAYFQGPASDYPGLAALLRPPVEQLSADDAEHVRHIEHIVRHWAAENQAAALGLSLNGYADGPARQFTLSLTTIEEGAPAVDAAQSQDPFAPDTPAVAEAQQASAEELAPPAQPAEPEPAAEPAQPAVEAPAEEPAPVEAGEPALDPTPPAESAGPTDPSEPAAAQVEPPAAPTPTEEPQP